MRFLCCVSIVSALLISCDSYWTTTSWTTRYPYTTVGPGVNLKGKMVTLSQYSGVTFSKPYYQSAPEEGATTPTTTFTTRIPSTTTARTTTATRWTTGYYTTTPRPPTDGVSVCLRFMADSSSFNLFKLAPGSPLTFSFSSGSWYSLSWNYYSQVSVNPRILLWSSVRTQPWTSVCLVLDSVKNVVQVFQGGSMSIRKMPPSRMVWTGEPVLDVSGFDGQVTDLEVWDYPLKYGQVLSYMQNYGSSGTVLSWSNIAYRYRGDVLLEETYAVRQKEPLSSSEDQEPIRSRRGRGRRLKYRNTLNGKRQRRRQTL